MPTTPDHDTTTTDHVDGDQTSRGCLIPATVLRAVAPYRSTEAKHSGRHISHVAVHQVGSGRAIVSACDERTMAVATHDTDPAVNVLSLGDELADAELIGLLNGDLVDFAVKQIGNATKPKVSMIEVRFSGSEATVSVGDSVRTGYMPHNPAEVWGQVSQLPTRLRPGSDEDRSRSVIGVNPSWLERVGKSARLLSSEKHDDHSPNPVKFHGGIDPMKPQWFTVETWGNRMVVLVMPVRLP